MRAKPEVLLASLADSVKNSRYDSQLLENIKVLGAESTETLEEVLAELAPNKFPPLVQKSLEDGQLTTLLDYVKRLIPLFKGRLLASYAHIVADNVSTTHAALKERIVILGLELMSQDPSFAKTMFDHFQNEPPPRPSAQNLFRMISLFGERNPKSFFANLASLVGQNHRDRDRDRDLSKSKSTSLLPLLRLIAFAVEKQLPFLASYGESSLLDFLVEAASTNSDATTVSTSIIILSTVLPSTVVGASQRLAYLYGIIRRVLLWSAGSGLKDGGRKYHDKDNEADEEKAKARSKTKDGEDDAHMSGQVEPTQVSIAYSLQQPLDDMEHWMDSIHANVPNSMVMAGRLLFWRLYGLFPHWLLSKLRADWLRVGESDRQYQLALTPMLRCLRLHPLLLRGEDDAKNPAQVAKMWVQMSAHDIVSRIERLFAPDRMPGGHVSFSTIEQIAPALQLEEKGRRASASHSVVMNDKGHTNMNMNMVEPSGGGGGSGVVRSLSANDIPDLMGGLDGSLGVDGGSGSGGGNNSVDIDSASWYSHRKMSHSAVRDPPLNLNIDAQVSQPVPSVAVAEDMKDNIGAGGAGDSSENVSTSTNSPAAGSSSSGFVDVWTVLDAFEPLDAFSSMETESELGLGLDRKFIEESRRRLSALSNLLLYERSIRDRLEKRLARALDEAQGSRQLSIAKDSLQSEFQQLRDQLSKSESVIESMRTERILVHEESLASQRTLQATITEREVSLRNATNRIAELQSEVCDLKEKLELESKKKERENCDETIESVAASSEEGVDNGDGDGQGDVEGEGREKGKDENENEGQSQGEAVLPSDLSKKLSAAFEKRMIIETAKLDGQIERDRAEASIHDANSLRVLVTELKAQLETRENELQIERHLLSGAKERITSLQHEALERSRQQIEQKSLIESLNNAHSAQKAALEDRCRNLKQIIGLLRVKIWEMEAKIALQEEETRRERLQHMSMKMNRRHPQ